MLPWALPPVFRLFSVFFKRKLQILQQINVKKFPSSIQCWDLNLQSSERESPPITTRPGLPLNLIVTLDPCFHPQT